MSLHEIVLPETKPETEWVRGRALQTVSPRYRHGSAQLLLASALRDWAVIGGRGRVATEWPFRIAPPGEIVRPLVPDVGFLSYAALSREADHDDVETPLGAPSVAVEVLSRGDRSADVADKVRTYLRAVAEAVIVVDPYAEAVRVCERDTERTLGRGDVLRPAALPGFSLDLTAFFERVAR
ncbi:MAG TPA: Uma2 family endonuclease [Candidatus Baltobacteraceae bacterium]|nr:Uma2 family endonuclease [Candidatus Baltobacteraceae bacterium]